MVFSPRTGAKTPAVVPQRTDLGDRGIPYKAPHRRRPNLVLQWVAALPMTVAQNYHIRKCVVFCLYESVDLPQVKESKASNCSRPQKARMPISWRSVGMTTSWSAMQLRKTSLPICVGRGGSQMWVTATHWVKVDLRRAVPVVGSFERVLCICELKIQGRQVVYRVRLLPGVFSW